MFGLVFEEFGVYNRVLFLVGCMFLRYLESFMIFGYLGKFMNFFVVKKVDQLWFYFLLFYGFYWFFLVNNWLILFFLYYFNKKKYLKFNVLFKFKKKIKEYK